MSSVYIDVESNPILQEWMEQAEVRGGAKVIRRMLERKFGPLPAWALDRLKKGEVPDHESWSDKVLDAKILEDVLGKQ